jgi:3-dehydrosphinganine reductase
VDALRHVIVTGGSSGIGKETARCYYRAGANVTLIARRQEALDLARKDLLAAPQSAKNDVLTLSADVSDAESIEQAIAEAVARFGAPDILINSAGIAQPGYFEDLQIESFHGHMAVNYFGTLNAIKAVLPMQLARGRGQIVLVSSGAALMGIFGYTAYGASKFAVRGLAEALRSELRPKGIAVTIIYPPDTDTPQLIAENKTKPPETKMISGSAKIWSAERVAEKIVRGVAKRRFIVAPGWEMSVLAKFHSVLRPALDYYFDRRITKMQADEVPKRRDR